MAKGYVYGWQYGIIPCPFCDKGQIDYKYYPSEISVKRGATSSLGRVSSFSKSRETKIIQSDCPVCGKTAEEISKELENQEKGEIKFSKEKRKKRYNELMKLKKELGLKT